MYYKLFIKQRFQIIKEYPPYKILYFPLTKEKIKVDALNLNYTPSKDRVEITLFNNFFCPVGVYMYKLIKKVAHNFGKTVKIVEIKMTPEIVHNIGTTEPLINGKIKLLGPASEEEVKITIQEEINQLKK